MRVQKKKKSLVTSKSSRYSRIMPVVELKFLRNKYPFSHWLLLECM